MAGLTDRFLAGLKPPTKGRLTAPDSTKGLALRVAEGGTKTWAFTYKRNGLTKRIKLGEYPSIGLSAARSLARKCLDDLDAGRSPAAERAAEKLAGGLGGAAFNFAALCDRYVEEYAKQKKRSWRNDVQLLKRPIKAWGDRAPAGLRRREILDELDRIAKSAPVAARRTFAILHKLFRWAVSVELLEVNQIAGADKPGMREQPRERSLDTAELRAFWNGLDVDGSPVTPQVATALRLTLLTAQRPGQISGLRVDELVDLDGEAPMAQFSARRMKTARAHACPLGPLAVKLIKSALGMRDPDRPSQFVFPARNVKQGDVSMTREAMTRSMTRLSEHLGMTKNVTCHDLRRSGATFASAEGISIEHIERLLAHRLPGISQTYNRHAYAREKLAAVLAIETYVNRVVLQGG